MQIPIRGTTWYFLRGKIYFICEVWQVTYEHCDYLSLRGVFERKNHRIVLIFESIRVIQRIRILRIISQLIAVIRQFLRLFRLFVRQNCKNSFTKTCTISRYCVIFLTVPKFQDPPFRQEGRLIN